MPSKAFLISTTILGAALISNSSSAKESKAVKCEQFDQRILSRPNPQQQFRRAQRRPRGVALK